MSPSQWVLQAGVDAKYQIVAGGPGREWAGYDDFTTNNAKWVFSLPGVGRLDSNSFCSVAGANGALAYRCSSVTNENSAFFVWGKKLPLCANWLALTKARVNTNQTVSAGKWISATLSVAKPGYESRSYQNTKLNRTPEGQNVLQGNTTSNGVKDYSGPDLPAMEEAYLGLQNIFTSREVVSWATTNGLDGNLSELKRSPHSVFGMTLSDAFWVVLGGQSEYFRVIPGDITDDDFLVLPDPGDIEYRAYLVDTNGVPLLNESGQPYLPAGLLCDSESGTIEGVLAEDFLGGSYQMRVEAVYRPDRLPGAFPPVLAGSATVQLRVIPAGQVNLEFVPVGNPGNAAFNANGRGRVDSTFYMGKYKVTVGQYATFLNAAAKSESETEPMLYSLAMGTHANAGGILRLGTNGSYRYQILGSPDKPAAFVSWQAAARFCNWLENGQGSGSILTGTYDFSTNPSGWPSGSIVKNPSANFRIPNGNDWFKAAYHDPTKTGTNKYWRYATRSEALPGNSSYTSANQANFKSGGLYFFTRSSALDPSQNYLTDVGAFQRSASYYGTFDQNGNLDEWIDELAVSRNDNRMRWGGAWTATSDEKMKSSDFLPATDNGLGSYGQSEHVGFRILRTTPP